MAGPPSAPPWTAIDDAIAANPTRPLLTCYLDPADGEADRIDLTGRTWATWVAKTVNLLLDLGGVDPGSGASVRLRLPPHWQTTVWTEAALRLGARVLLDDALDAPADTSNVVAADPARLDVALADDADEVFLLPLLPMNGSSPEPLPAGVWDYAAEVSAFGDRYSIPGPPPAARGITHLTVETVDTVDTVDTLDLDAAGVLAAARARGAAAGLQQGGRLLTTGHGPGGPWVDLLAAVLSGGSLVLSPDAARLDPDRAATRWAAERVTAVAGADLAGAWTRRQ